MGLANRQDHTERIAVLETKVDALKTTMDINHNHVINKLDEMNHTLDKGFVRKENLEAIREEVKKIQEKYVTKDSFESILKMSGAILSVVSGIIGGLVVYVITHYLWK